MSSQHSLKANEPIVLHSGPFMPSCRRKCALGTLSVRVQVSSQNVFYAADAGDQDYLSAVPQCGPCVCMRNMHDTRYVLKYNPRDCEQGSNFCELADG